MFGIGSLTHTHTHTHTHTPLPQEEVTASWRRIVHILSPCEGDLESSLDTEQQDDEDEHLSQSGGVKGRRSEGEEGVSVACVRRGEEGRKREGMVLFFVSKASPLHFV